MRRYLYNIINVQITVIKYIRNNNMLIIDIKYLSVHVKSKIQNLINYIAIKTYNTHQLYTIVYRHLITYLIPL